MCVVFIAGKIKVYGDQWGGREVERKGKKTFLLTHFYHPIKPK
jgi:hypothetical protein